MIDKKKMLKQREKVGEKKTEEKRENNKKNFKTFLFDSEGKKYFFVILYGDK